MIHRPLYILFLVLVSLSEMPAADLFSRYYQNQPTRSVQVSTAMPSQLQNGELHLTERQAIQMALENNLDINVERYAPLLSHWLIEGQRSVYDPIGRFAFHWDRTNTPTASVLQGGTSVTNILTTYDYGYSQTFSTGTTVEAGFVGARNRTTNFFSSLVPAIDTSFQAVIRQNLLEGFGRIAPDYQIEISRNNLEISRHEFERKAADLILQVQDRYWELQYALQDIEVKEKSLQLAETVLEQNQARLEIGTAARLEVVQAEAESALRRAELIRSQFGRRRIQDQLIKLISNFEDPRDFPAQIVLADPVYTPDTIEASFDQLAASAGELRPELQEAELQVINQEVNLDLSRNRLKPTLDLVAGYQQFGLGGTRVVRDFSQGFIDAPIVDVIPGGLGDSLAQLFSSDFYGYVVGLDFRIPIFNTEARAQNAEAQLALNRSQLSKRSLEQTVALEIRDALTQVEMNQARLEAAAVAVRSARERLEGEQVRFDVGLGTTRELIEAQRDLLLAESVELQTRVDLIKSHNLLDRAVGRTFARQGIRLDDALQVNLR
ncbi:MAG: TolC family protein [Acidobacteriota bacterium]